MRRILLCSVAAAATLGLTATSATTPARADRALQPGSEYLLSEIKRYRLDTWRWQQVMGKGRTRSAFSAGESSDAAYRHWVLRLWQNRAQRVRREAGTFLRRQIERYRVETWRWQRLMGRRLVRGTPGTSPDLFDRLRAYRLWKTRAEKARRRAASPPRERAWLCIQRHEGAWDDPHAPYYGGLQMDAGFQRTYGGELFRRKGTADNWTPIEQMWVAERAFRSGRGFYPWPNTARYCGLI